MTTKATRRGQSSRTRLHIAFELSLKEWKLAFSTGLAEKPVLLSVKAGDLEAVERAIRTVKRRLRLPASTPVVSCYEAGRDGFWLHRYLLSIGIENSIVDSASIEVNRRMRRAKSDRLDATKLVTMLIRWLAGEKKVWSVARVPSATDEDRRHLHRELRTLKQDRTRVINRIKGYLANQGVRLTRMRKLTEQLEQIRLWDGSRLGAALVRRLRRECEHFEFLHEQILAIEAERRAQLEKSRLRNVEKIRQLMTLRALGAGSSYVLVNEFFGWRKFKSRKQIGALSGLTPTNYQSGDTSHEQGISKAGNRQVRAVAIQLAWAWLRYQPRSRLSHWYDQRFARGGKRARKVGIVALARKLLIELWRFLEWGVIPEGAELKV
ncbi:MAG: IS110 family transposase [Gemmatimonadota bacterium]|nr:IS110 family transposase [Gemmatimonadota bacterium]